MLDDKNPEALNRLREEFRHVVEVYNAAIKVGKVRSIRQAASTAHQAIFALSQTIKTLYPNEVGLLSEVEAAFMDVRWGRLAQCSLNEMGSALCPHR